MSKKKEETLNTEATEEIIETPETVDSEEATESQAIGEEMAKLIAAVAESEDRYMRLAAEYANFRNRTIKEREAQAIKCVADTVKELLPAMDNIDRALLSVANEEDSPVKQGLELICRSLSEAFAKIGVEKINAQNTEFNPNLHEAVMHIDDDSYGENVVVEELQTGYIYKETVIRHSMVKVAN